MKKFLYTVFVVVLSSIISVFFTVSVLEERDSSNSGDFANVSVAQNEMGNIDVGTNTDLADITDIIEDVKTSVVGVSSAAREESTRIFDVRNTETWSMGSGVILTDDGYILTNHHVIGDEPSKMVVTLSDGDAYFARHIWSEPALDLAVIKIDKTGLNPAKLGDTSTLKVGQNVIAIGNPLSLQFERTVTSGIISALNRAISVSSDGVNNYMENLIQTDASINPGNSGGPLVDMEGNVIGINTIKVTSAEGMGFAIPIDIIKPVIKNIIKDGYYNTPYVGIYAYDKRTYKYVTQKQDVADGLFIVELDTNGPAYLAGIRVGDVILEFNRVKVLTMMDLREELFSLKPGDTVNIKILRDGGVMDFNVVLGFRNEGAE